MTNFILYESNGTFRSILFYIRKYCFFRPHVPVFLYRYIHLHNVIMSIHNFNNCPCVVQKCRISYAKGKKKHNLSIVQNINHHVFFFKKLITNKWIKPINSIKVASENQTKIWSKKIKLLCSFRKANKKWFSQCSEWIK